MSKPKHRLLLRFVFNWGEEGSGMDGRGNENDSNDVENDDHDDDAQKAKKS